MSTTTPTAETVSTDAPLALEPTLTSVVSEHPTTRPAAYDWPVWCAVISCSTDTVRRIVETDR